MTDDYKPTPVFCCRCDNCMGFSSHVVFNDIWCFWCDKDDEGCGEDDA